MDLPAPDGIGVIPVDAPTARWRCAATTSCSSGDCPTDPSIVDLVGYGRANCSETAPAGSPSNITASLRGHDGCDETNDNSADFANGAPTPRNSGSPIHICSCWLDAARAR